MKEHQISIAQLNLRPEGMDTDAAPESVLKGTIQIGTGTFHVSAIQVEADDEGILQAVNSIFADDLDRIYGLNCNDSLSSIEIEGRNYVLVIYPFSN